MSPRFDLERIIRGIFLVLLLTTTFTSRFDCKGNVLTSIIFSTACGVMKEVMRHKTWHIESL